MITIALVENNKRQLDIIANHIASQPHYKLLTTATNGFDMLRYCYSSRQLPQVIVVDIEMGVMDGISLIDYITRFFNDIKCIVCSNHHHKEMFEDAICCGAIGLVSKLFTTNNIPIELGDVWQATKFNGLDACIEAALKNEFYIDDKMEILAKDFLHHINRNSLLLLRSKELETNAAFGLTQREWKIASLCSTTTATLDDIAALLSVSTKTLQGYLTYIYQKLNINSRMELVRFCSTKALVKQARELLGKER